MTGKDLPNFSNKKVIIPRYVDENQEKKIYILKTQKIKLCLNLKNMMKLIIMKIRFMTVSTLLKDVLKEKLNVIKKISTKNANYYC